jgi:pimeloyl-ACP methyl ester carboxylesterase
MAKDLLEVLDHIGWTSERQLHILGVSMGGMIALEIVCTSSSSFPRPNSKYLLIYPTGIPNPYAYLLIILNFNRRTYQKYNVLC